MSTESKSPHVSIRRFHHELLKQLEANHPLPLTETFKIYEREFAADDVDAPVSSDQNGTEKPKSTVKKKQAGRNRPR